MARIHRRTIQNNNNNLNDPDNYDGVVIHLESDILDFDVKWASRSITVNKASGGDGFLAELFQILKEDAIKLLHSICRGIWKTQQWPQDWKRSVFIPISKTGNAKECSNYHTISFISHASKVMLKTLQARLQQCVNWGLPDVQVGFRKGRGTKDQIANIHWIIGKARKFQKNIYFCFTDDAKVSGYVHHTNCVKFFTEMGISDHFTYLLRILDAGKETTVRTGHGTMDWFKTGKGVHQVHCHLIYLTSMQIIPWEMLGWMKHKLESRFLGEISTTSDIQMIPLQWHKMKRN